MRKLQRSLLASAIALALAASGTAAAQFSNIFFFGDSLTDAGNYKAVVPPGTGLFTTNPGPVWPHRVRGALRLRRRPRRCSRTATITRTAARASRSCPAFRPSRRPAAAVPIATQVQQYLAAAGPADPNAIYSLQAAATISSFSSASLGAGAATPAQVQAALGTAAVQLGTQVAILNAAGARYLIVWNVPDIGLTPDAIASGQAARSPRWRASSTPRCGNAGRRRRKHDPARFLQAVRRDRRQSQRCMA